MDIPKTIQTRLLENIQTCSDCPHYDQFNDFIKIRWKIRELEKRSRLATIHTQRIDANESIEPQPGINDLNASDDSLVSQVSDGEPRATASQDMDAPGPQDHRNLIGWNPQGHMDSQISEESINNEQPKRKKKRLK